MTMLHCLFYFVKMPKKKLIVEGSILNLEDMTIECVDNKSDEELLAEIRCTYRCHDCNKPVFAKYSKIWRGRKLCQVCHTRERNSISAEFEEYIREVYSRGCAFCAVKSGRFHLDHVNMFSKTGTVGTMILSGRPADEIKAEIAKCQLLCIDCHGIVTRFEHKRGFMIKKRMLNRKIKRGEDVTELRKGLCEEYDAVMSKVYPLICAKVCEGWRVGGLVEASGGGSWGYFIRHELERLCADTCGDYDGEN